jgi:hypothetical protein
MSDGHTFFNAHYIGPKAHNYVPMAINYVLLVINYTNSHKLCSEIHKLRPCASSEATPIEWVGGGWVINRRGSNVEGLVLNREQVFLVKLEARVENRPVSRQAAFLLERRHLLVDAVPIAGLGRLPQRNDLVRDVDDALEHVPLLLPLAGLEEVLGRVGDGDDAEEAHEHGERAEWEALHTGRLVEHRVPGDTGRRHIRILFHYGAM